MLLAMLIMAFGNEVFQLVRTASVFYASMGVLLGLAYTLPVTLPQNIYISPQ
jgi:hypothetical protein